MPEPDRELPRAARLHLPAGYIVEGPARALHRRRIGSFGRLLKKASTTRSAKKSNEGFVRIATTILSLEILASSFAGWSAIYPRAASRAQHILKRIARSSHMPLMEFYLYPPKHISSAAIAALAPPASRQASEAGLDRASKPELVGEKIATDYLKRGKAGDSPRSTAAVDLPRRLDRPVEAFTPQGCGVSGFIPAAFLAADGNQRPAGPGPGRFS